MNLLTETLQCLKRWHYTAEDITYIGSLESGHSCTWEEFCVLANVEYDNGFGAQQVASDLVIVFKDNGLMRRHEYDGAEGWECIVPPVIPHSRRPIKRLTVIGLRKVGWCALDELQEE